MAQSGALLNLGPAWFGAGLIILDRLLMRAPALRVWIYPQSWLARFKAPRPSAA